MTNVRSYALATYQMRIWLHVGLMLSAALVIAMVASFFFRHVDANKFRDSVQMVADLNGFAVSLEDRDTLRTTAKTLVTRSGYEYVEFMGLNDKTLAAAGDARVKETMVWRIATRGTDEATVTLPGIGGMAADLPVFAEIDGRFELVGRLRCLKRSLDHIVPAVVLFVMAIIYTMFAHFRIERIRTHLDAAVREGVDEIADCVEASLEGRISYPRWQDGDIAELQRLRSLVSELIRRLMPRKTT